MEPADADVNGARPPGNLDGRERFVPDLTVRRVSDGSHRIVHEQPAPVSHHIRECLATEMTR